MDRRYVYIVGKGTTQGMAEIQNVKNVSFKTKTPVAFKALMKAVASLVDETTLEFTPEGMVVRQMDPPHISIIDIYWPSVAFESYECTGTLRIGIHVKDLVKILRDFDSKRDCIQFQFRENDETFTLDNGNGSVVKVRVTEPYDTSPLPILQFTCKLTIDGKTLEKVLKAVRQVSTYVKISYTNNILSFSGKGDSGEIAKQITTVESTQDSEASYSLDYLLPIHSALRLIDPSVTLEYADKKPARLSYQIDGVGSVQYYLAPKMLD